jgi:uncharacterized small protein (DUF1192 family)
MLERMEIQSRFRQRMADRGLSVGQVAAELDVQGSTLRRFLDGDLRIAPATVAKVKTWLEGGRRRGVIPPSEEQGEPLRKNSAKTSEAGPAPAFPHEVGSGATDVAATARKRGRPSNEDRITVLAEKIAALTARVEALEAGRSA